MEKIPSEYTGVKGLVRSMYDGLAESAADSNNEYIKPFPGGYEYIKTVELCNGKTQTVSGSSSAINPLDIASGRVRAYLSIGDTVAINGLYGIISLGIPPDGNVGNNPYIYMNSGGIFGYYGDEEAPWFMVAQRDVSIGGTDYHGGDFFVGSKDYAYLWWEHDEARLTIAGNILIGGDIESANFEYDPGLGILNGYKLEYEGGNAYFGGAVISGSSSVGGRLATTIGSAIDSSGNLINDVINSNLSTASKQILGDFTFGTSGALQIGTYENGVSGDIRISPNGILGRNKDGDTTFSINGTTGDATFGGTLVAASGTFGTVTAGALSGVEISGSTITGGTIQTSSTGDRIIMNGSTNKIEFKNGNILYSSMYPYAGGSGSGFIIATHGSYVGTASLILFEGISTSGVLLTAISISLNGTTYLNGATVNGGNITPSTNNSYSLGTNSYRFNNVHTNAITLNGIEKTSWPTSFSGNWSDIYINTNKDMQGYNLTGLTQVIPHYSYTSYLGNSSYYWDYLYVNYIYGAFGSSPISIKVNAWTMNLFPEYANSYSCGTTSYYWYQVSTRIITGNNINQRIDFISTFNKIQYHAYSAHDFYINGSIKAIIDNNFWTAGNLMASGTKPFIIDHPDKSNKLLRYTAQESPEVILRDRGKAKTSSLKECEVITPKHFEMVTDSKELVTVNITPIGNNRVYIEGIPTNKGFRVKSDNENVEFFYEVIAIRKGYANAAVEIDKDSRGKDKELFDALKK